LTLLFLIFIVSVLAHAAVEVDALTDVDVVNITFRAVDPDVLNE